jgi:SAM-dependent methyltransferase
MRREEADASTATYYEQNAKAYFDATATIDMADIYDRFLCLLPAGARILDAGCGSGRDTLAFLRRGFVVDPFDASPSLARLSSAFTGVPTRIMRLQDLDEPERYDGVWACASLLHVPGRELPEVMRRIRAALRAGGVLYASFKLGSGERLGSDGRLFNDLDEDRASDLFAGLDTFRLIETWRTAGEGAFRSRGEWLNLLARKEDVAPAHGLAL